MSNEESLYKKKIESPFPQALVHVDCPECHTPTKSENIDLGKGLAKCHHCAAVFDFDEQLPPLRRKPEVFLPKGVEVLHLRNEVEIKYKWRKSMSNFTLFFTLFWNALLLPFVMTIIMTGDWSMLFFMSLHLAVGMGLLYNTLANLLNTTYVTVDASKVSIEHGPLRMPFNPDMDVHADDIHQVYVEKYSNGSTNGVPNYVYQTKIVLKNSKQFVLAKGFKHPEPAQYIEQEIEQFLGIDDIPISNELR